MAAFTAGGGCPTKTAGLVTNIFGECKFGKPIEFGNHPVWYRPTEGHDSGLRVHNSLLGDKHGGSLLPTFPVKLLRPQISLTALTFTQWP